MQIPGHFFGKSSLVKKYARIGQKKWKQLLREVAILKAMGLWLKLIDR